MHHSGQHNRVAAQPRLQCVNAVLPFAEKARPARRTVIFGSAQHWDAAIHLSSHHLAKLLARRGWRVCFLSTPTSFLHRALSGDDGELLRRYSSWSEGGSWDASGHIFQYTPLAILPPSRLPFLRSEWLFRNWANLTFPSVVTHLRTQGFGQPDLMIADSALMLSLWHRVCRPRLIYRVTDRNCEFPGRPPVLDQLEHELAASAELVVTTGQALEPYVAGLGARESLCVANGVDLAHFSGRHKMPQEYYSIPEPRAIYVGSIAKWFDAQLVSEAASRLPNVNFVIIGPGSEKLEKLKSLSNIHLLGARPYSEIPAYLTHATVGLIPFGGARLGKFIDDINPLKLYEYMCAGLPVVSTSFEQIRQLQSPAVLANGIDEFVDALVKKCRSQRDGQAERAFAARFDWTNQFAPLVARLDL